MDGAGRDGKVPGHQHWGPDGAVFLDFPSHGDRKLTNTHLSARPPVESATGLPRGRMKSADPTVKGAAPWELVLPTLLGEILQRRIFSPHL